MAEILKVTPETQAKVIRIAADHILAGKAIALPTDTLYGLAADPYNLKAVNEINRIKRRTVERALPLLVDSIDRAAEIAQDPPELFFELAKRYWPGALTLVVAAAPGLPLKITGNTGKVGLRWPKAPVAEAIITACGRALTGTSANLTENPPCTTAEDVMLQIGDAVPLIVDGGPTPAHVPSTVIELLAGTVRLIRAGAIPEAELKDLLRS
jgi:L-threonylcarbamoyladenylate synthase